MLFGQPDNTVWW